MFVKHFFSHGNHPLESNLASSSPGQNNRAAPFMSMTSSQQRIVLVCFSRSLGGLELSTLRIAQAMKTKGVHAMVIVPPILSASPALSRIWPRPGYTNAAVEVRRYPGSIPSCGNSSGQEHRPSRIDAIAGYSCCVPCSGTFRPRQNLYFISRWTHGTTNAIFGIHGFFQNSRSG